MLHKNILMCAINKLVLDKYMIGMTSGLGVPRGGVLSPLLFTHPSLRELLAALSPL